MPEEEYIPQSQQSVAPIEAYGDRGGPQAVPTSNEDFFSAMDAELNREIKFDEETMEGLTTKFTNMKDQYAEGDKADQALLEADVVQTGGRMVKAEEFKKNLASLCSTDSGIGHNPTEKFAEYTDDIVNIVNGNNEVLYDGNIPGYELHDGWKSMDDIEELVKTRYVDETSSRILSTYIQDQELLASEVQPGEDSTFNWQKNYNKVKNHIIETGDIRSLATDKIFGNRVFKDDLLSAIEMGTYKDMGLTEEQVHQMDPNQDGKITTEDAAQITSNIMQDEDMLKKYLVDYYTKAMEQNYYNNLSPAVRRATQWKNQYTPQTIKAAPTNLPELPI
tara:strand:+ start:1605 stop:2606 length:1002 start_codon:yes stop_codon:yes gene_type:complete